MWFYDDVGISCVGGANLVGLYWAWSIILDLGSYFKNTEISLNPSASAGKFCDRLIFPSLI